MQGFFQRVFLDHPRDVGETYAEHGFYCARTALMLLLIATALFIHGLVPFLFPTTASTRLPRLVRRLQERLAKRAQDYHL